MAQQQGMAVLPTAKKLADSGLGGSLGVGLRPGAMTNTVMPQPVPVQPNPTAPYTAPTPQTFGGQAPTPTPYGDFTAPDPTNFQHSPDYQYLLDSQQKALQRGAASHGSLFTGGFQKALSKNAAGIAAGDYQNAYDRALGV